MTNDPSESPIQFSCPRCQSQLRVGGSLAGSQVKCPNCDSVIAVPQRRVVSEDPEKAPVAAVAVPAAPSVGSKSRTDQENDTGRSPVDPGLSGRDRSRVGQETETRKLYLKICEEIATIFVGQEDLVTGTLVALFSGGHVLIESVPGLGKTLFVRTLGRILGCEFGRIQFTADLMPSDITGAPIFNMKTQEFEFRAGPVFTQMLLADEINRSPAKTHAALLEIMQEKRVTVDGVTHPLELPFLVVATQNPLESEGTYNLPEAQLDRFMLKLIADYPSAEQEARILLMHGGQNDVNRQLDQVVSQVTQPEEILRITRDNASVRVDTTVVDYINRIVRLTRKWPSFYMGASPRAGIGLIQGARTLAAFLGRDYVVPDDVIQIALPVLRHRVQLTAEAEVEGQNVDQLLTELIRTIEVPRIR